ncbi:MAG: hypothetical protein PHD39_01745 [Methylobacter tundripaludum]|nr:hypothetical protein [Methylobacter tundripaludum]
MTIELTTQEINDLREKSGRDVQGILRELESNVPGITEGFGAITGAGIGGAASLAALSGLGTAGLSAAGITSGLATAGGLVGGGMVAGVGVLAAPIAVLGIVGYSIFKHRKVKKQTAALQHALGELYSVLERLVMNAQYFQEEIAGIRGVIDALKMRAPA